MGYMCHHAIVVTSWKKEAVEAAHVKAVELFGQFGSIVSNICKATTNGYYSFLTIASRASSPALEVSQPSLLPSGAIRWIEHGPCCYEDGTHPFDWCEVQFNDDYDNDYMVRSNNNSFGLLATLSLGRNQMAMRLGTETISFQNHMLSGTVGAPEPEVGMGATILMWSDRHAATIVRVTKTQVHVQRDKATRIDNNGMSESQRYTFEPNPEAAVEVFRKRKGNRWVLSGGGASLRIGDRSSYHDFSF